MWIESMNSLKSSVTQEARLQHSTIPILSTTQNYLFTSQVYSTFPFMVHLSPDFVLLISLH